MFNIFVSLVLHGLNCQGAEDILVHAGLSKRLDGFVNVPNIIACDSKCPMFPPSRGTTVDEFMFLLHVEKRLLHPIQQLQCQQPVAGFLASTDGSSEMKNVGLDLEPIHKGPFKKCSLSAGEFTSRVFNLPQKCQNTIPFWASGAKNQLITGATTFASWSSIACKTCMAMSLRRQNAKPDLTGGFQ